MDHVLQPIKMALFPLLEFDSCLGSSEPMHSSRGTRGPRHLVGTTPSDERGYTTSCYDMLTRVGSWSQDPLVFQKCLRAPAIRYGKQNADSLQVFVACFEN